VNEGIVADGGSRRHRRSGAGGRAAGCGGGASARAARASRGSVRAVAEGEPDDCGFRARVPAGTNPTTRTRPTQAGRWWAQCAMSDSCERIRRASVSNTVARIGAASSSSTRNALGVRRPLGRDAIPAVGADRRRDAVRREFSVRARGDPPVACGVVIAAAPGALPHEARRGVPREDAEYEVRCHGHCSGSVAWRRTRRRHTVRTISGHDARRARRDDQHVAGRVTDDLRGHVAEEGLSNPVLPRWPEDARTSCASRQA
jgi:hypothetical protein